MPRLRHSLWRPGWHTAALGDIDRIWAADALENAMNPGQRFHCFAAGRAGIDDGNDLGVCHSHTSHCAGPAVVAAPDSGKRYVGRSVPDQSN